MPATTPAKLCVAALFALLLFSGCGGESLLDAFYRQPAAGEDMPEGVPGAPNTALSGRSPYDKRTAVVVSTAADIYASADNTSKRLTQVLFDRPVRILEASGQWIRVDTGRGAEGWMRAHNADSDWTCIDWRRYAGRIVVTSKNKQIYSSPRNGIVVRDVSMGTELFVISKSENVYEVALPGNLTGWLSENGTFQLDVREAIKETTAAIFAQSCEKFRGTSYLQGGVSYQGIDGAGLLYASAKVNGVLLPGDLDGQFMMGVGVGLEEISVGDVLFFSSAATSAYADAIAAGAAVGADAGGSGGDAGGLGAGEAGAGESASADSNAGADADATPGGGDPDGIDPDGIDPDVELYDAGVYVGDGRFIHASQHAGKVMYEDLGADPYYQQRLYAIRRYFRQ
ncbi:MAG: C40 family peptidase [Clostridiales bacterium]|jgi:hypothetical protein|nr:C40 family peptidase [Clostridiales bacterium]